MTMMDHNQQQQSTFGFVTNHEQQPPQTQDAALQEQQQKQFLQQQQQQQQQVPPLVQQQQQQQQLHHNPQQQQQVQHTHQLHNQHHLVGLGPSPIDQLHLSVQQQYHHQQLQLQQPVPQQPLYNGVNWNYPGLRCVSQTPPIFVVDNFLTPTECQFLIHSASDSFTPAPVVGKGAGEVSPSRTSSTCYLAREDVPDLMVKVSLLTGKPIEHCELPQVGRYFPTQQYYQHYDAFNLDDEDGLRFASNGGQRTITVLIYLNDVPRGGATSFPVLGLNVQPQQGMALVFFPATVDGQLDKLALHAALPAVDTKFVSQVWIRQSNYYGQPSKRLPQIMNSMTSTNPQLVYAAAASTNQQQPIPAVTVPATTAATVTHITNPAVVAATTQAQQQYPHHHTNTNMGENNGIGGQNHLTTR